MGALLVLGLIAVALLGRARWEVATTTLTTTSHATSELSGELRVAQVTDFHNIPRYAQVREIVALVRDSDPHVIALTGDLINTSNRTLEPVRWLLRGLSDIGVPMYFVDGNHDHWSDDQQRLHGILEQFGVQRLSNEHRGLSGEWGQLTLIGVDDYFSGHGDLAAAVDGAPDGFRFVLTHSPEILPHLDRHGIDYAICGHTHGGQIRLPFIGAIYQPHRQFFPKVSKGGYTDGAATLFVDSGVGVTGPKLRFLNQSQVTLHRIGPAR